MSMKNKIETQQEQPINTKIKVISEYIPYKKDIKLLPEFENLNLSNSSIQSLK